MQEVCSSMDTQLGIKSELSPMITGAAVVLGHQPPPHHQAIHGASSPSSMKMAINCDKRDTTAYWMTTGAGGPGSGGTESGFINSQPSMAEFLTQIDPESPKMGSQVFPMVSPSDSGGGMDVPEYPWMKEKKTARKNSSTQGKFPKVHKSQFSNGIMVNWPHRVFKDNFRSWVNYWRSSSGSISQVKSSQSQTAAGESSVKKRLI